MQQSIKTIALVAGEASGDLLGSHLIKALKQAGTPLNFVGIGGPKMQAAGMDVTFPMEKLAVNGYVEVLRHYREIVGIRNKLRAQLIANPPDLFIGIDAPDFNLDLELDTFFYDLVLQEAVYRNPKIDITDRVIKFLATDK